MFIVALINNNAYSIFMLLYCRRSCVDSIEIRKEYNLRYEKKIGKCYHTISEKINKLKVAP